MNESIKLRLLHQQWLIAAQFEDVTAWLVEVKWLLGASNMCNKNDNSVIFDNKASNSWTTDTFHNNEYLADEIKIVHTLSNDKNSSPLDSCK